MRKTEDKFMEKKRVKLPIIVEGRYDKSTISGIYDATVITTDGFSVFNSKEKVALIKKLAEKGGIILLTDSDAGGRQIRSFLSGVLPKEKIFHLYIPEIEGKEKRKTTPSKSGLLGVEGMSAEVIKNLLEPFTETGACKEKTDGKVLTKLDFYNDGFSGSPSSSEKRKALSAALGLPRDMSANALIEAINLIYGYEKYKKTTEKLFGR